ncbi:MAG: hypothetical protein FJ186_03920 [Gammaproteobacteria bacterium]|jgi:apolipoprotein N-acyltransferase|nr:hypothetical protein [Gammaproteobacteria bacterium]
MSAVFLFLSYAPFWQSWAIWVYFTLLYQSEKLQKPLVTTFITWTIFHFVQYHWLIYPLQDKLALSPYLGWFLVLVASIIHAALLSTLLLIRRYSHLACIFPVVSWIIVGLSFEWLKLIVLGGFPWITVAITQMSNGFSWLLPIFGQLGTCILIFFITGLFIEHRKTALLMIGCLFFLTLNPQEVKLGKSQMFRVYQIPDNNQKGHMKYILALLDQSQALPKSIAVFPEGVLSIDTSWLKLIQDHVMSSQSPVLLGVNLMHSDGTITNSAATKYDQYDKQVLVPFGEVFPPGFKWAQTFANLNSFVAGEHDRPIVMLNQLYNVLICYDIFFPKRYLLDVDQPIILLMDDHWYGNSWVRQYHFRQAEMVSKILGQSLISAGTDGVTGFIENGKNMQLEIKAHGFISKQVHLYARAFFKPIYWLESMHAILAILGILIYSLDAIMGRKCVKSSRL